MELKPSNSPLARFFDSFDQFLYAIVGFFLVIAALFSLYQVGDSILKFFVTENHVQGIVKIIDHIMLVLMIIEILYTVRVSIQQRSLCAEPFLIVAMIAAIRRILVISVESGHLLADHPEMFSSLLVEIAVLGVLVLFFVIAILLLRRFGQQN